MSVKIPLSKLKKAARLLLYKSHTKPGIKGWELRSQLGESYLEVISALNKFFKDYLGLKIIAVDANGNKIDLDNCDKEDLKKATFMVLIDQPLTLRDFKTAGWRIDEIAVFSVTLLYLLSHNGKARISDIRNILRSKFLRVRTSYILEKLIRMGYLEEKDDFLVIGWRSRIEIDFDKLLGTG